MKKPDLAPAAHAIKKTTRILVRLAALLVIAAAAAGLALYFLITPERAMAELDKALSKTPYRITLEADPEVRVMPELALKLPAGRLVDETDGETALTFESASFKVSYPWLALLRVHVKEAVIDGLVLPRPITKNTFARPAGPGSAGADAPGGKEAFPTLPVTDLLKITRAKLSVQTGSAGAWKLYVKELTTSGPNAQMHAPAAVSATLTNADTETKFDFSADGTLDLDAASGLILLSHWEASARGLYRASPAEAEASAVSIRIAPEEKTLTGFKAKLSAFGQRWGVEIAGASLGQTVSTENTLLSFEKGSGDFTTAVTLSSPLSVTPDAVTLNHVDGSVRLPQSPSYPVTGNLLYERASHKVSGTLSAQIEDNTVQFSGSLGTEGTPELTGQLTFSRLSAQALFSEAINPLISCMRLFKEDIERWKENAPEAAAPNEAGSDTASLLEAAPAQDSQNAPAQPGDWMGMIQFTGGVAIGELDLGGVIVTKVETPAQLKDGALTLKGARGILSDGPLFMDATLNGRQNWSVKLSASAVSYEKFAAMLGAGRAYTGTLALQTDLYGTGFDKANINGQAGFMLNGGRFYGSKLDAALEAAGKGQALPLDGAAHTDFTRLQGLVTIANSEAQTDRLSLETPQGRFTGGAAFSIAEPALKGSLSGQVAFLKASLNLSGPWYDPDITVSASSFLPRERPAAPRYEERPAPEAAPAPKAEKPSLWNRFKDYIQRKF